MCPALSSGRLLEVVGDIHPREMIAIKHTCFRQNPAYRLTHEFRCGNSANCHPRAGGDPPRVSMDSRLRGNDTVT